MKNISASISSRSRAEYGFTTIVAAQVIFYARAGFNPGSIFQFTGGAQAFNLAEQIAGRVAVGFLSTAARPAQQHNATLAGRVTYQRAPI